MSDTYPAVGGVEIAAFRPRKVDVTFLENIERAEKTTLPRVAYVVKLMLDKKPPPTANGLQVFVGPERMRLCGEYSRGFFLLVHNRRFLVEHAGAPIQFSWDGVHFHDTGARLPAPPTPTHPTIAAIEAAAHPTIDRALES